MQKQIVIYDLEYTAWEGSLEGGWSKSGEYREIVQIGAVMLDRVTLEETDALSLLVRPVRNPILSDYFVQLTGITQDALLHDGVSFEEALSIFHTWAGTTLMYAWGHDGDVLRENYRMHAAVCPFLDEQLLNVKPIFAKRGIDVDMYMSSTIIEAFGKKSPYRQHNALNDARTIALALREIPYASTLV